LKATNELLEGPVRLGEPMPGTDWVVTGVLGRGGMGLVLEVRKEPGIMAAIKILLAEHARNPEVLRRFKAEVAVLAKLDHPHIVRVLDWGMIADGRPYIVMERLRGQTLRAVAVQRMQQGRRIPARMVYEIVRQVCEGLQRAHSHVPPVVHRDLKPDNLFLHYAPYSDHPTMKVIDFGVAELLDDASDAGRGMTVGTLRYMAPEVIRGDPVTAAADLYAMALVVYEVLTTRQPWDETGSNATKSAGARLREPPQPASTFVPWIPKSVDECLLRALSMDPAARHETISAFVRALYELQFANDGSSYASLDADTTAPNLATLALGPNEVGGRSIAKEHDKSSHAATGGSVDVAVSVDEAQATSPPFAESPTHPEGRVVHSPELEPESSGADAAPEYVTTTIGAPGSTDLSKELPLSAGVGDRRASRRRALPAVVALSLAATGGLALMARGGSHGSALARARAVAMAAPSSSEVIRPAAMPFAAPTQTAPAAVAAPPVASAAVARALALPKDVGERAPEGSSANDRDLPSLGVVPVPSRPPPEAGIGSALGDGVAPLARPRPAATAKARPRPRDDGYDLLSVPQ
jgi:serine/threonine-protein kinase